MRALVVEARAVDRIHAEDFYLAGLDEVAQRADHSLILELPFVARARGETDQRLTVMAVHDDTHVPANAGRIPAVIFAFHASPKAGGRAPASVCGFPSMPVQSKPFNMGWESLRRGWTPPPPGGFLRKNVIPGELCR